MGQKVNPNSIRITINKNWDSRWITKNQFAYFILADDITRKAIYEKIGRVGIERIIIERGAQETKVTIHTSRPGIIIGRSGRGIQELKKYIDKKFAKSTNFNLINSQLPIKKINEIKSKLYSNIKINIKEIRQSEFYASLVAADIANQLEKRMPYRKVIKKTLSKIQSNKLVKGVKVCVSGRLGGVDIARVEKFSYGSIPLATFKSKVDYACVPAKTSHGMIGVKVWIHADKT